jgi:hypothetical protein
MEAFELSIFTKAGKLVNQRPIITNGVTLEDVAPKVIEKFEQYPLGEIEAILLYKDNEFVSRYTVKNYLEKDIPKAHEKQSK